MYRRANAYLSRVRCGESGAVYDEFGDGECDYACTGDSTLNCGGYLANAVYEIGALVGLCLFCVVCEFLCFLHILSQEIVFCVYAGFIRCCSMISHRGPFLFRILCRTCLSLLIIIVVTVTVVSVVITGGCDFVPSVLRPSAIVVVLITDGMILI